MGSGERGVRVSLSARRSALSAGARRSAERPRGRRTGVRAVARAEVGLDLFQNPG